MTGMAKTRIPTHAMVLAAGLGLRMRPLTRNVPKPMLDVGGRSMLDHALDRLEDAGVAHVVVNTHWLPEQIEDHLKNRSVPATSISREDELLETGGGIVRALPMLGDEAFYAANADIVWRDGTIPALHRLARAAVLGLGLVAAPAYAADGGNDDDDEEDLIEDASDLGEDDDDVAEVMDGIGSDNKEDT